MLMQQIREKLLYLGDGIVDASTLLNHQVDVDVLSRAAHAFARRFEDRRVDKVLTIEVSGIVPALLTARELGVPMVYARKGKRVTQKECYEAPVKSRTTDRDTIITVDKRMLGSAERVLVVDDFLARGAAVTGIAAIIEQAGATLVGVCAVFEKTFEGGRENLKTLNVPIRSFINLNYQDGEFEIAMGDILKRRRLRQLTLKVTDLGRSLEFYTQVLGMTILHRQDQKARISDQRGFELTLVEDPGLGEVPDWLSFGFPMESKMELERAYAELHNQDFRAPLEEVPDRAAFKLRDPDGYAVEFYLQQEDPS